MAEYQSLEGTQSDVTLDTRISALLQDRYKHNNALGLRLRQVVMPGPGSLKANDPSKWRELVDDAMPKDIGRHMH